MLDLKADREPVPPKDAATIVLVREGRGGVEVFCVERNRQSRFMGGAVVFPGGKLDPTDADEAWAALATPPRTPVAGDAAHARALAVAACRETLEEAAILPVVGGTLTDADLREMRARVAAGPDVLRALLAERGLRLDLGALYPLASYWAFQSEVLRRYDAVEVQLMPPTHRTLALLAELSTPDEVLAHAERACLDPICPRLVKQVEAAGETLALVLPGDPEHEVPEARVAGGSRYVLRGEQWRSEGAP